MGCIINLKPSQDFNIKISGQKISQDLSKAYLNKEELIGSLVIEILSFRVKKNTPFVIGFAYKYLIQIKNVATLEMFIYIRER